MNVNKNFMPESFYSLDDKMSLDKITRAKDNGDFLVAKAVSWDNAMQCIIADLGNGFKCEIPLNEFTIYPIMRPNGFINPSVYSLIGQTVCVCVQEIYDDNTIVLSRKANMLKTFEFIEQCENKVVTCSIRSIARYGLFVDVGFGISGLIKLNDLTLSRINHPADLGFKTNQFLDAKIISVNSDKHQIGLNHKDLFENQAYSLNPGDIVEVTTLHPINEIEDGYFVHISHNTPALMDPPDGMKIPYGTKVLAIVKPTNPKHPDKVKLRFLQFID